MIFVSSGELETVPSSGAIIVTTTCKRGRSRAIPIEMLKTKLVHHAKWVRKCRRFVKSTKGSVGKINNYKLIHQLDLSDNISVSAEFPAMSHFLRRSVRWVYLSFNHLLIITSRYNDALFTNGFISHWALLALHTTYTQITNTTHHLQICRE